MDQIRFEMDINGIKKTFEVIATYHDNQSNKDYMVYSDFDFDKEKKINLFHALFEVVDNQIKVIKPKSIKDKKIGLELVGQVLKDIENVGK